MASGSPRSGVGWTGALAFRTVQRGNADRAAGKRSCAARKVDGLLPSSAAVHRAVAAPLVGHLRVMHVLDRVPDRVEPRRTLTHPGGVLPARPTGPCNSAARWWRPPARCSTGVRRVGHRYADYLRADPQAASDSATAPARRGASAGDCARPA